MDERHRIWLSKLAAARPEYERAAQIAKGVVEGALVDRKIELHSVTGRAKSVASVTRKLATRGYRRPNSEMTDIVGVRVITAYARDVERVAELLRQKFEVDDRLSSDKTSLLGVSEFGYRSVHLQLAIGKTGSPDTAATKILATRKVEVQVRSIMEHAWAEAEHELRYKSGVSMPDAVRRRFNALSAVLEVADRELDSLQDELFALVDHYGDCFKRSEQLDVSFDSARLIAYLSFVRPNIARLGPRNLPTGFHDAAECVSALADADIGRPSELVRILNSEKFRDVARQYSATKDVDPDQLSGFAVVGAAAGLDDPNLLGRHPIINDTDLLTILMGG